MDGELNDRDRWLVPLSLWASYLANDGEEWLTMASSLPHTLDGLPSWAPAPPIRHVTQRHVRVGIISMGLLYGAAVVDGIRTRGRGGLYQDAQWVFGLHGFSHIGVSMLTRRYSTGVITSPTIVIPQLVYAVGKLRAADVPSSVKPARAAATLASWLVASHALGYALSKGTDA